MSLDDGNNLVGSSFSLVRYNNPVLIDKKQPGENGFALSPAPSGPTPGQPKSPRTSTLDGSGTGPVSDSIGRQAKSETEEILVSDDAIHVWCQRLIVFFMLPGLNSTSKRMG